MKICVIGDIHGSFSKLNEILEETESDLYIQVGDLAQMDFNKSYYSVDKPVYFIPGNHERQDIVSSYHKTGVNVIPEIEKNLFMIPFGHYFNFDGVIIGGLGGNFSPKRYQWNRKKLQYNRRKHFTISDVLKLTNIDLDILVTHEAPKPFKYYPGMNDLGCQVVNDLIESTNPKYHFFGHHHKYWHKDINGTKSYCSPLCDYLEVEYGEL